MILAIVDDLMFTSKIRTAAKQLDVELAFARSPEQALTAMRDTAPTLVIFDLNSPRTNPLSIVAAMKADDSLRGIRTLGFVSHVQADLIQAARNAGVEDVMARSAFSERLGQLLMEGSVQQPR